MQFLETALQHCRGQIGLTATEMDLGERRTAADPILECGEQLGGFVDPALLNPQLRQMTERQGAVRNSRRLCWTESVVRLVDVESRNAV